jgi:hypothetical protein
MLAGDVVAGVDAALGKGAIALLSGAEREEIDAHALLGEFHRARQARYSGADDDDAMRERHYFFSTIARFWWMNFRW